MLGGNYTALALALEDYVTRLRDGGVELLVALDPAHGTEEVKKGPPNVCKVAYQCMRKDLLMQLKKLSGR